MFVMFAVWFALASAEASSTAHLRGQMAAISHAARGRVGAAVLMIETGESVTLKGSRHFPMQSVYKLPIAMAILRLADQGIIQLEQKVNVAPGDMVPAGVHSPIRDRYPQSVKLSVADLLRFMVSESDGTACDVLLRLIGGPRPVNEYLRSLGVHSLIVATTEKEMAQDQLVQYRNWASPEASHEAVAFTSRRPQPVRCQPHAVAATHDRDNHRRAAHQRFVACRDGCSP
jgi:beta-lactamase class A